MFEMHQLKALLKRRFPLFVDYYRHVRQWYAEYKSIKYIFSDVYYRRRWGDLSISGPGATLIQTETIRVDLPFLLEKINARSLLDAPCGDFNWMKETKLNLEYYIGADIVPELIAHHQQTFGAPNRKFVNLDIISDDLPKVDVILCRDCLVHFSYRRIFPALRNFKKSGSTYLLTTSFPDQQENIDIITGGWRPLNLQIHPFNFPKPIDLIDEKLMEDNGKNLRKVLGLWQLNDIAC